MNSPRRLGLTTWTTRIVATIKMPAPPAPVKDRPTKNQLNEVASEVMSDPTHISNVEKNMQSLGLKTCESRPMSGAKADMAIK